MQQWSTNRCGEAIFPGSLPQRLWKRNYEKVRKLFHVLYIFNYLCFYCDCCLWRKHFILKVKGSRVFCLGVTITFTTIHSTFSDFYLSKLLLIKFSGVFYNLNPELDYVIYTLLFISVKPVADLADLKKKMFLFLVCYQTVVCCYDFRELNFIYLQFIYSSTLWTCRVHKFITFYRHRCYVSDICY